MGQFADGGGLAHAVHPHHNNDMGLGAGDLEGFAATVRIAHQTGDLRTQDPVQFGSAEVAVPLHALLYASDDLQRGFHADIAGDQGLFQGIEDFVVHVALPDNGPGELAKERVAGAVQAGVQLFFLLLTAE